MCYKISNSKVVILKAIDDLKAEYQKLDFELKADIN